jgi:histone H3/H4
MPKSMITKTNTVETFIKAHSKLRVGKSAITTLLNKLNTLSIEIVEEAESNAIQHDRKTIMASDIKEATTTITGSTSDLPFLFKQIENLNAKDTAALSELIKYWVESH